MGKQRRRLADLYVAGREVTIDDGHGGVTVWLQKLNSVDHDLARRRGSAARARALLAYRDPDSDEYRNMYSDVTDFGERATLVEYLIQEELYRIRQARESELAAAEEWSEDGRLEGLRDAWEETLKDRYAADPEDAEAKRAFNELKRFADEVDKQVDGEAVRLRRDYEEVADDDLRKQVAERFISTRADLLWVDEFRRSQLWLATRDPDDHKKHYFHSREEVDQLADQVFVALADAYKELTTEPMEGKGSRGTPPSSPSSEQPEPEATEPSSGRLAAVR